MPGLASKDRLMGFSITVDNGQVARLPECPAGWTITVTNDPNWRATIEGQAIVGAASIPAPVLPRLVLVGAVPAADVLDAKDRIRAWGKLTFMRDGEPSTVDAPRIDLLPVGPACVGPACSPPGRRSRARH